MKKTLSLLLAVSLLFVIDGCNSQTNIVVSDSSDAIVTEAEITNETVSETTAVTDESSEEQTEVSTEPIVKKELTEAQTAAAEHLIECWKSYITYSESIYSTERWALSYVKKFLETNDWKDLCRARTAIINANVHQTNLEIAIDDLSSDEYNELMQLGVDTTYQSTSFSTLSVMADSSYDRMRRTLFPILEDDIFTKSGIDSLTKFVEIYEKDVKALCLMDCATFNYQMVDLARFGVDVSGAYKYAEENCTTVVKGTEYKWLSAVTACQEVIDNSVDDYSQDLLEETAVSSKRINDTSALVQAVKNNDTDYFKKEINIISSLPVLLYTPSWYNTSTFKYMTMKIGSDGTAIHQEALTDLNELPYINVIYATNVTEEMCTEYILEATKLGYKELKGTNGSTNLLTGDYIVMFTPSGSDYLISFYSEDVTFAPLWYINLLDEK